MRNPALPDYCKHNVDGDEETITVTLAKGIIAGGEKRTEITLREPTVGDNMAARQSAKGDNAGHEVNLLANLAGLSPDEIRSAKMRDYTRLQEALDFLNG
ncbi:phage tail assembly protein [Tritonibacter mobilis]|uniref:phage tail assembly protein n=1 Tax=Tritonibacter mobilis TaxID=379347 RepID=UPI001C083D32|nr:phage tail assembly protein [Tritonibacter mobilis]MBU3035448.1 phage tail assembly protein [Tritonibacter mobilis]WHQ83908.1 phage tail assembly protein [Tritonibacter mobilis]